MRSDFAEQIRSHLWIGPLAGIVLALGAGLASLYLDRSYRFGWLDPLITADADSARSVLTAIASAMIALTVFTFSITMLVVQLASMQYSPRVLRSILRDRPTKVALALFLSTFVFSLIALRGVDTAAPQVVPTLSLALTYLLSWATLFGFVMYIDHVAHSVRIGWLIARLGRDGAALIAEMEHDRARLRGCPRPPLPPHDPGEVILYSGAHGGAVSHIEQEELVREAARADVLVEVLPRVGDFVPRLSPVMRVYGGELDQATAYRLVSTIGFARERTLQQDIAYALRQLCDIGCRALSPAINDPTTAVQVIDQLHELLRTLAPLPDQPEALADDSGVPRVIIPRVGWDNLVALAVTELRIFGARSPQIPRRLRAMLLHLREVAPPERQPALVHQLQVLDATIEWVDELEVDRRFKSHSDDQGIGAGAH